ncbi:cytochrome P450 4C1-like, partial [Pogonomyrmex barbatus]|uniref:Cytochrome P450 4C1-like n=1 Tax=Pogonomyrmex barbatus TaxID=144034 RepID=A0A6I9WGT5_9HYME
MFQVSQEDLWKLLITLFDQYYSILKVWFFFTPFVGIRHPDDIEIILGTSIHIEKSLIYNNLHPWLNTGLLTSGGNKWHSRRKILTPTFHFGILQQFADILITEGENMANSLKNTGDIIIKDLISFISEHTLNALCVTAMGISLQKLDSFQQEYRNAIHQISELLTYRVVRIWLYNDWVFSLTPKGRQQKRVLKVLHRFTEEIIAARKLYHEQINERLKNCNKNILVEGDNAETDTIKKKRLTIVDLLIAASRDGYLTDSDIKEEIDTFLVGGHDTTAMTISYVLLLLADHKDVQNRVREEVNAVMHESEGKFTMQSLQKLSYLERCIKETLRLYPVVYFISRVTSTDIKLQSYLVPAGTTLFISIYGVHRDP